MSTSGDSLTVEEAQRVVLEHVRAGRTVGVRLAEALGCTLAEAVRTDLDYPPFDRSIMDGYAVRSEDLRAAPVLLKLTGHIAAGSAASRAVGANEAVQINTGAPIPAGADAVVRLEETELAENGTAVRILVSAKANQNVAFRGEYAQRGQVVLKAGCRLGPGQIGVAGSAGAHDVEVYARPEVAVLSTGSELVDIDQVPAGAQIRNSNSYVLMTLVDQAGGRANNLGNVADDSGLLEAKIGEGLKSDALCITGGVSVGVFDLVPAALKSCGVRTYVHKIKTRPGKPTIFGVGPSGAPVFALPGNPVSAFIGFWLLARPALAAMQGRANELPTLLAAVLRGSLKAAGDRQSYIPARVGIAPHGEMAAEPVQWGGSGDPFGLVSANAMVVRPIGASAAGDGDTVMVMLLETL